jgi:hypothetical protein
MKVTIAVFLAVAVAYVAGSTGSLVSRARPLFNDARIKSVNGFRDGDAGNQLQTQLVVALQQQAEAILNQIDNAIQTGQQTVNTVVSEFQQAIAQLQAAGSDAVQNGQQIVQNLIGSLLSNIFGGNKGFEKARQLIVQFELPAELQQAVLQALQQSLTTDQYNQLISQLSPLPGTGSLINQLVELMLEAAKPNGRAFTLPPVLQQAVEQALAGLLTTDQYNNLISELSPLSGTNTLVGQLVQLMLEAAKPNGRAFTLPPVLQQAVEQALAGLLTTDQYNNLISQLSPITGTNTLVGQLVQLMLEAAKPHSRSASENLNSTIVQGLQGVLTTDQYNALISQLSIIPGTQTLIGQLLQLMLEAARPHSRSVPVNLQSAVEQALQGHLSTDQYNTLISQLSPIPGTEAVVGQLVQLMLEAAKPQSRSVPANFQSTVQQALQGLLTTDQYNALISQLSVVPGTQALIGQLLQLMLEAAKPHSRSVPVSLQSAVEQALQGLLTTDQYNTLISQLSPISGTEALVNELVLLMLEAAKPHGRSIPNDLRPVVEQALQGLLTSDQYNTLISQLSPIPGTQTLISQLVQLMLQVSKPNNRALQADLQSTLQQGLQGLLTTDQYNALISQLWLTDGNQDVIGQLLQLMLEAAKPPSRSRDLSQLTSALSNVVNTVQSTLSNTITAIQTLAQEALNAAITQGSNLIYSTAQQLLTEIEPLKDVLGGLYNQLASLVAALKPKAI